MKKMIAILAVAMLLWGASASADTLDFLKPFWMQMMDGVSNTASGKIPENVAVTCADERLTVEACGVLLENDYSAEAHVYAVLKNTGSERLPIRSVHTSNRRHLIKETLTDRTGDDIHEADTRQELMSLSARFGLTVTFQRPEKARFETILAELAKQHGIDMPMDQLLVKAEAFAIRAGGRSPRVAKQFIEQCEAGVQK